MNMSMGYTDPLEMSIEYMHLMTMPMGNTYVHGTQVYPIVMPTDYMYPMTMSNGYMCPMDMSVGCMNPIHGMHVSHGHTHGMHILWDTCIQWTCPPLMDMQMLFSVFAFPTPRLYPSQVGRGHVLLELWWTYGRLRPRRNSYLRA